MLRTVLAILCAIPSQSVLVARDAAAAASDLERPPTLNVDGDGSEYGPGAPWRPPPKMTQKSATALGYPRTATLNLDLPPRERWVALIRQYRDEIIPYYTDWKNVLSRHTEIDQDAWSEVLKNNMAPVYLQELEGIYETLNHPDVDWKHALLLTAVYELGSPVLCSEIIAAAPDGTVLHGRNLDFKVLTPVIEVTYLRNNEPAYTAPMYLGGVGMHTGLKPGHLSYGTNTRISLDDTPKNTLSRAGKGAWLQSMLARTVFDQSHTEDYSYDYAVAKFRDTVLCRAAYFILGGPGPYQGAVISRWWHPSFRQAEHLASTGKWWAYQGNDDNFLPSIGLRHHAGMHMMSVMTQKMVSPERMINIMHSGPLYLASNVVLFVMSAKSGTSCSILGKQIKNDDTSIDCRRMGNWTSALPPISKFYTRWQKKTSLNE